MAGHTELLTYNHSIKEREMRNMFYTQPRKFTSEFNCD